MAAGGAPPQIQIKKKMDNEIVYTNAVEVSSEMKS